MLRKRAETRRFSVSHVIVETSGDSATSWSPRKRHADCVRILTGMLPKQNDTLATIAALGVWELVWAGLELLIVETRELLGNHLRERPITTRRFASDGWRQAGELTVGRTRLRLECPLHCAAAAAEEPFLREAFGPVVPLARIFVLRTERDGRPPRLESVLGADPLRGTWACTEPELGPASLRDLRALEMFFWSLIVDRADSGEAKRPA
jgi:hypothetical protein